MLKYTKRTTANLASLNHVSRAKLEKFFLACGEMLEREFPGVYIEVISGHRSGEQQEALYAQGRTKPGRKVTNAKPWTSWHQYGLAADTGLFSNGTYLDESNPRLADKIYSRMAALSREHDIEAAYYWKSFQEGPHFQYTGGIKSVAAARRRYLAVKGDIQKMFA